MKQKYCVENKDKKSLKQLPLTETVSRSNSRSTIKEHSFGTGSPAKEFIKISEKLSLKMKKLKSYITQADKDFKKAKKALDSLSNSARSAALKIARSMSSQKRRASDQGSNIKRQTFDVGDVHRRVSFDAAWTRPFRAATVFSHQRQVEDRTSFSKGSRER